MVKPASAPKQYDIVILGHSLAGRLTAALTAKKGCRVLVLADSKPENTGNWSTSSLLLERILDLLDGHACRTGPFPFQIMTDQQRIDVNVDLPLADELRRELPDSHHEVMAFLNDLLALGGHIEDMLWDSGGLPSSGFFARQRFRFRSFRGDVPQRVFRQSLRDRLATFSDPEARKVLGTLFCGTSLQPPARLSLADCALIWSGLGRTTGISRAGLDELLRHRFRQFHGTEAPISELRKVRISKEGRIQLLFSEDRIITTEQLIVADRSAAQFCDGQTLPAMVRQHRSFHSGPLGTKVSALLQPHVVLAGTPPLRLTLQGAQAGLGLRVDVPLTGQPAPPAIDGLETRLTPLFPFVSLRLSPQETSDVSRAVIADTPSSIPGAADRIYPGRGRSVFYAGSDILPGLGTPGEVLCAITLCNRLLTLFKKPEL